MVRSFHSQGLSGSLRFLGSLEKRALIGKEVIPFLFAMDQENRQELVVGDFTNPLLFSRKGSDRVSG